MTRKNYQAFAAIISRHIYDLNDAGIALVSELADYLKTDNPNFNRERFADACIPGSSTTASRRAVSYNENRKRFEREAILVAPHLTSPKADVWYEVWTTWGGVLEESHPLPTYFDARKKAEDLADELTRNATDDDEWEVYLLPHSCGGSIECECVQYLTDHKPVYNNQR